MTDIVNFPVQDITAIRRVLHQKVTALIASGATPGPHIVSRAIDWYEGKAGCSLSVEQQRQLIHELGKPGGPDPALGVPAQTQQDAQKTTARLTPLAGFDRHLNTLSQRVMPEIMALLDLTDLSAGPDELQRETIARAVRSVSRTQKLELNGAESTQLVEYVLDDMMGFGPLERLLADDTISDIMVNGPQQVYIERHGQLELSDVTFRNNQHVLNIATRIVSLAGRRVDETTPLVDARLPDGSRINVTIPPLALKGPTMTIRKFPKSELQLADLVARQSMSSAMAEFLRLAARMRLNILISGGTGSGKTTVLNAISGEISASERIVTIEDAAELRLQQPHVVSLETRPPSIEGLGEITMRHLFRNTLRMRPDRIIIGEVRSEEALDLLQAMNTGHDGSMSTLHANSPRESLTRLESMIAMSGVTLPSEFVRQQIASAVDLVVQIARMRDGVRRVVSICEIVGAEGNTLSMQELFSFSPDANQSGETIVGKYHPTGTTPYFAARAVEMGLDTALRSTLET